MGTRVETWALLSVLACGGVLLAAAAVDRDWGATAIWAALLVLVARALVRRRRRSPSP